jgi:hypothetical protein
MNTTHISQDEADEFALGALEAEAERRLAMHLIECPPCREMAAEAQRVASYLALGAPLRRPSADLRQRVFEDAGIRRPGPLARVRRYGSVAAVLAAFLVAAAAFTGMVSLRDQVSSLRNQNAAMQRQLDDAASQRVEIAAVSRRLSEEERRSDELLAETRLDKELLVALLSPESDVATVFSVAPDPSGAAIGRLIWDREQKKIWFIATGLAKRPPGETYQIWASSDNGWVSLGTFNADDSGFARYETFVAQGLSGYHDAVVTIERWGEQQRSGPSVFAMDLTKFRR